jgi:porphobilinogen synthase
LTRLIDAHNTLAETTMKFPRTRLRRLRQNPLIRGMVAETVLNAGDFVLPLFVRTGAGIRRPVASMPGVYQMSIDEIVKECGAAQEAGIRAVILFGIPAGKDEEGRIGYSPKGIVQRAIPAIKKRFPDLYVITDVCNCEYTTHGHCGPLAKDGSVDNDRTISILAHQAMSHARAGCDMVAPSDMMDGRIGHIRDRLDVSGFEHIPIMAYSAKYASGFYGPFRDAAESAPKEGDRRGYQMDPRNSDEALREVGLDIEEGADIVMVKPALSYCDIIRRVKDAFNVPVAAYNVSGEYSMVKAAAKQGWIDHDRVMMEILTSIKRAGADIIISYHAIEAAGLIAKGYPRP